MPVATYSSHDEPKSLDRRNATDGDAFPAGGGIRGRGRAENVLGAVLSKTTPQRVLFVFLPAVADTVGVELGGMLSAAAERKLARALARVIVHEAFHAIAPKLPHAKRGLTRANLTRDALLRGDAEIDTRAARAFRRHLARLSEKAAEGGHTANSVQNEFLC